MVEREQVRDRAPPERPRTRERSGSGWSRAAAFEAGAAIVAAATGLEAAKIMEMLTVGEGNSGNKTTGQMKFAIKYHRVRSVHVTPTVFLNGVESPDISSGWTAEQWHEKIAALLP